MRIAFNGRLLIKDKLEGIGYFTLRVIREMIELYPQHDYLILFDRPPAEEFLWPGVEYRVVRPAARHPLLYRLWFQVMVPWHLRAWDAEIFLSFDGFNSLHLSVPTITVIHDLAYLRYPEFMKSGELNFYRKYQPLFAMKSDVVLTVSQFSKEDILRELQLPSGKIHVVYNGSRFEKSKPPVDMNILEEYRLTPQRYILYTGSLHPRKNIVRLIKAFEIFSDQSGEEYHLVLAGRSAWKTEEINAALNTSPYRDRILLTGYVSDKALWTLLSNATMMCYVSVFEGFGVPVLDAFHAEVPVIAGDVSSIPEVAGGAALLVDPFAVNAISAAMIKIAESPELRKMLIQQGRIQRQRFSWRLTTHQIYDVVTDIYDE